MQCPACQATTDPDAWICPECDHILDTSFLSEGADVHDIHEEKTSLLAWGPTLQPDDPPDAMILGNVDVPENEFSVVTGPGARSDGRTSTFVYYTADASSRLVRPAAVPTATRRRISAPLTPYEERLLAAIDGRKTVREIQMASGLALQDVVVSLLTLIDKGAIHIPETTPAPEGGRRRARGALDSPSPVLEPPPLHPPDTASLVPSEAPTGISVDPEANQRTRALSLEVAPAPVSTGALPDDFDDLPSVSDVEEVIDEAPPPRNYSDVWADEEELSGIDAVGLIEAEAPISSVVAAHRADDLEPTPSDFPEEVTAALEVAVGRLAPESARGRAPSPPSIAIPEISPAADGSPVERFASRARLEPLAASSRPPNAEVRVVPALDERLPPVVPVDDLGGPEDIALTKEVPAPLSAKFLQEVEGGADAPGPDRQQLARALRAPVQERDRRGGPSAAADRAGAPTLGPAAQRLAAAPIESDAVRVVPAPHPPPAPQTEVVDSVHTAKAKRLFDQALKDEAKGHLVSARMNMKLALTFDPTNDVYNTAYEQLSKDPAAQPRSISSVRSQGRELYDEANDAERRGDVDKAVELLEKAIKHSRRAPFLNRLGVLLAMKKRQFMRAQTLIEEAIELAPSNSTYERNLQKVLSMAASAELRPGHGGKKGGLLGGLLGRRK